MFGLGKTKISRQQLVELFAKAILQPLNQPSEQDRAFLNQALAGNCGTTLAFHSGDMSDRGS
jgi:hypothetical protein